MSNTELKRKLKEKNKLIEIQNKLLDDYRSTINKQDQIIEAFRKQKPLLSLNS